MTVRKPPAMTKSKAIEIETTSDRVVCRWSKGLFRNFNPVDEEVLLKITRGPDLVTEHKVEHLSQKEIHLDVGDYDLELSR
jgi:hypothetical protein